ncbi:hypothetical protein N7468_004032 [Penicillium chermesinum]|uniref:PUM-HD domain-containing protein n=1 Tax=Penicillium chermesinum TaxID=63820 RepID=A0A9W9PA55_9EURO|nr:uncharacterized protein N7468_004032 [Penicillium chermesinum]KAJ5239413.1 hypothetical protein N7468_004032 [Penicillium chermesinum]
MREQKRRFEEDMKLLDLQHEKEKFEMDQLARSLAKAGLSSSGSGPHLGRVSEPTTPPGDYGESIMSTPASRPSHARFPNASVTSSPGFFGAFAGSALTSPQTPLQSSHAHSQSVDRFVGHSLPGSRRNSERDDFFWRAHHHIYFFVPPRPFSSSYRANMGGFNPTPAIDSFAAAKHLFHGDDEKPLMNDEDRMSTPDIKGIITMTEPDDKFPILSRRSGSNILSANPDAHDLANPRAAGSGPYAFHSRHHATHQSMPQNVSNLMRLDSNGDRAATQSRHHARRSLQGGIGFSDDRDTDATTTHVQSNRPISLQSSYSTNDLPTIKGTTGFDAAITPPKTHADHLHQHNASMGRIPSGVVQQPRTSRESPVSDSDKNSQPASTMLQASAAPFGPQLTSTAPTPAMAGSAVPGGMQMPVYGGYPMPVPGFVTNNNAYGAYAPFNGFRFPDRVVGQRRNTTEGEASQMGRFTNYPLEHYKGELYTLCKDQHGCRYLQRKLEERNADHVQLIFSETYMHVIELMTDPFGNYLCQKLLEFSNDEQRTALINNAAPQLVKIALNQHGTRALQKMIEFISTPEQTQTVIHALENHVVELVQDLNGNHVIQKCLNRLTAEDAEFIYDAVGSNCVTVGTHRHGCCVLQRCIDHASGDQKARLIAQITANSFALVQDPFGNYVVQYILDLAEPNFTTPLCRNFAGNIPALSKQKFSSNVIEKCLRTADPHIRREMVEEMLSGNELEKMLRDSFANYVIQTAMDYSDADTRNHITEAVRPILPSIRQTPHGRRIAGKIMAAETSTRQGVPTNGHVSANEMNNAHQLPKAMLQKGMITTPGPAGFPLPPTPAASSTANTPPGGNESNMAFGTPVTPSNNNFAQAQLYAYF